MGASDGNRHLDPIPPRKWGIGRHGHGRMGNHINPVQREVVKIHAMGGSKGSNIGRTGGLQASQ